MKNHLPPFGPTLRRFRHAKKLSQEELAVLLDVSPSYISRMESDLKKPSLEMIFRIAATLSISPHELVKAMES
jgi:transcriptional regulator with XRE-family HTH domain